ncbi:MAG: transposase [Glutamicibacter sp.]|uniref:transposase n=1 Tax=Glutamicibacter sp. TaxID=1931995 RepID=UPI002FC73C55
MKTESDVVEPVFDGVHWCNNARLHSSLGHQNPEEFERTYYDKNSGLLPDAAAHKTAVRFPGQFRATKMSEAKSLFRTLSAWLRELLVFVRMRLINARSETTNLTAKCLKRIGRSYRNHTHSRLRILLYTEGLWPY